MTNSHRHILTSLCGFILIVSTARPQVPEVIADHPTDKKVPSWVSATTATTPDGLDPTLFLPHDLRSLQSAAAANAQQSPTATTNAEPSPTCRVWVTTTYDRNHRPSNNSLFALANNSKAVYLGTIIDIKQGFYLGDPGSMLQVAVEHELTQTPHQPPSDILLFYQHARIRVGHSLICARPAIDAEAPVPVIGSRVLVFNYHDDLDQRFDIIYPDDNEFIFDTPTGKPFVPPGLKDVPGEATFSQILKVVQRSLSKGVQ